MNDVVDFNNTGVYYLLAGGDNEDAIRSFRRSLVCLKLHLPSSSPASSQILKPHSSYIRCNVSSVYHLPSSDKLDRFQDEANTFIYSRPIFFTGRLSLWDINHLGDVHSSVVIFNMALAHHQKGKVTGNPKFLNKAILLYGMCLELLERDERHQRIMRLIKSAALNNKSLLHFENGEYLEAAQAIDQLSGVLLSNGCAAALAPFDKEALDGFLFNIFFLKPSVAALAA